MWSPSVDELEDILPSSPPPPPPRQATPRALTQPSQTTSARGTPVGGLMSRTLRREDYAPAILRVLEPVLNQDKSDVTANHDDSSTTEVQPTRPGGVKTALTEVPSSSMTALPAPDRLPRVNWAENEVFHFNPEAHRLFTVPSASLRSEGTQYGPARHSSRACAKMLVRAGHRCSVCYCLISLCSCHHEKFSPLSCTGYGGRTPPSYPELAHALSCVSQAADLLFHITPEPLSISCAPLSVCSPHPLPHGWQHPHPHQWQVLHRSFTRRQRRKHKHRSLPPAAAQRVFHAAFDWLRTCSLFAIMNPHRPGGGPRQHYRPDGSRRRTAGELAKRAAKAAARAAAAAADAAGGGVAKPAVPAVAKEGAPAGPPAKATASVTTASLRVPPAPTSTSTSSTVDASTSVPKSEPVPTAYPSIAAAPKPGGGEHRTWLPALPALRVKAPPPHLQAEAAENAPEAPAKAPSPKRTAEAATLAPDVAPDETDDLKTSTAEPEQALIPTAPSGEPPRLDPTQLPPAPPPPPRSKRSRTQPPRQIPAADHAQTKWSQVTTLESMLEDLREADVATMLSLFQQAGHYATHHGPFHDLRDSLMHAQVCGPNAEPLPLPPVGNWILALGISLLGYDTLAGRELLTRLTNPQTVGDLTEAWAFQLWNRGHKSLCTQLSGFFMLLHNLLEDVPARVYSVLGQEWRLTWMEFRAVVRAWIGDPPTQTMLAITQVPETETAHGRFGRLSETLRARSLSPDYRGDADTTSGADRRQKAQNTAERAGTHHQVRCSPQRPTELGLGNSDVRLVPTIPRSLVTVTLHNPGNHCYLNSTVYLLAYACCMHAPHGPPRGATVLERAIHSVLANPGEDTPPGERRIAELPAWRSLLEHWHGLHQQQDAMELLHHLLERNSLPFARCQWEARPVPGTEAASRPLIRGSFYVSMPLPRRGHATLQDCIVQWHEQKIPHGLLGTPSILFVNLARYANIARGKNPIRLPCKALQKVSFPVFRGTGHDVTWTSYTLVAGVMHLGPQPQSGHYRSFLAHPGSCLASWPQASTSCSSEPQLLPAGDRGSSAPSGTPSAPSGSRNYTWWCTDDGKTAEVCHPTYFRTLSENCYVLCFCLTEHLNTC